MSKKKKGKKGRKEAFDPEKDTGILRPVDMTIAAGVIRVPMPAFGAMVLYHKCENPTIFVED